MKRPYFTVILLLMLLAGGDAVSAQTFKGTVTIASSEDILRKLPDSVAYFLPSFTESLIVFKDKRMSKAVLNICVIDHEVRFVDPAGGDTLKLVNTDDVERVVSGSILFIRNKGRFVKVVAESGDKRLAEDRVFSFLRPELLTAYGGTSNTASVSNMSTTSIGESDRNVRDGYYLNREVDYEYKKMFVLLKGNKYLYANTQSFLRLFPDRKAEIRAYVREHGVDFNSESDLKDLFDFCTR